MPGRYESRIWPSEKNRDTPPRHRRACRYEVHIPERLGGKDVRLDGALAALVSKTEQALLALKAPAVPHWCRSRAKAKAESGSAPGFEALEVLANIDAMVLAAESEAESARFGDDEILAIHRRLLERTMHRRIAGQFRRSQNWIGGNDYTPCGADFVPPPPDMVAPLLVDLCDVINDDMLPPLVQAALVHVQFETIRPFDDGHGRTGRALVHVVLKRRGIAPELVPPISVVFAGSRAKYINGLTRFRNEGDAGVSAWIEHFAAATLRATRLARAYIADVRTLQERWRTMLRVHPSAPRADAAAWAIIDLQPAHPMLSAPVATAITRRSKSRVYEAIEQLVAAGVLIPLSTGQRNRWWETSGLLDRIGQPETGEHPLPPETAGSLTAGL